MPIDHIISRCEQSKSFTLLTLPHFDIIKIIILGLKFGLMSTNYCLSTASGRWKPQVGKAGEGSKNSNYHLFLKEYI